MAGPIIHEPGSAGIPAGVFPDRSSRRQGCRRSQAGCFIVPSRVWNAGTNYQAWDRSHTRENSGAPFPLTPALSLRERRGPIALILLSVLILLGSVMVSGAALQFDVFLGYDGVIPEATWFPVVCEIKNDGPSFNGVIELNGGSLNQGQVQKVEVELPTGTLKRLVIPVFSATRVFNTSWDVRLLDERGKVRSEQPGLRANKNVASRTPLIGALARTPGGAPVIRAIAPQNSELQPTSARLQPSIFPDNALVLEGLHALYLNSEKATELKENQVRALMAWLNAGGHLIVAIEQINDVTASPWLKNLLPCEVKNIQPVQRHTEIQQWLQSATWSTNLSASGANSQQFGRRYGQPGSTPGGNQRNRSAPTPPSYQQNSVGQE